MEACRSGANGCESPLSSSADAKHDQWPVLGSAHGFVAVFFLHLSLLFLEAGLYETRSYGAGVATREPLLRAPDCPNFINETRILKIENKKVKKLDDPWLFPSFSPSPVFYPSLLKSAHHDTCWNYRCAILGQQPRDSCGNKRFLSQQADLTHFDCRLNCGWFAAEQRWLVGWMTEIMYWYTVMIEVDMWVHVHKPSNTHLQLQTCIL